MTTEQLDKLMKPYWESKFESAELITYKDDNYDKPWFGFYIKEVLLVGCPLIDVEEGTWFYNSGYFEGGDVLFGITTHSGFTTLMKRYLNNTYDLNIKEII